MMNDPKLDNRVYRESPDVATRKLQPKTQLCHLATMTMSNYFEVLRALILTVVPFRIVFWHPVYTILFQLLANSTKDHFYVT